MNSVTLIISVSVIILLLYVIISLLRRKTYKGSIEDAKKASNITVTANSSEAAAYSIWIYISSWNTDSVKNIFKRGSDITLSLDQYVNKLNITTGSASINSSFTTYAGYKYNGTLDSTYYYASDSTCEMICDTTSCNGYNFYTKKPNSYTSDKLNESYRTSYMLTSGCVKTTDTNLTNSLIGTTGGYFKKKNTDSSTTMINTFIPIQEWVFITINMDKNYTEVYINGKLVQTIVNDNTRHMDTSVTLSTSTTGFNGYNSKFLKYDRTLTTKEIWNNYKSGFGYYSTLGDYSIKVGFYKE